MSKDIDGHEQNNEVSSVMLWDEDVEDMTLAALILTGPKIEAVKSPSHGQQSHSCICERSSHACCSSSVLILLGSLREGSCWDLGRGEGS